MGFFSRIKEDYRLVKEEKAADKEQKRIAYSEGKQAARMEQRTQAVAYAREKEKVRGERRIAALRNTKSFGSQFIGLIDRATAPRRTYRNAPRKRKKRKKYPQSNQFQSFRIF